MAEMNGLNMIRVLRKKWVVTSMLADFLLSAGTSILFSAITNKFFGISPFWGLIVFSFIFSFLLFTHRAWKTSYAGISQLLNQEYPVLEESSGLLIRPFASLNILEKLQYQKTGESLNRIPAPLAVSKKLKSHLLKFVVAFLIGFVVYKLPFHYQSHNALQHNADTTKTDQAETILPQISHVLVSISPPSYTGRSKKEQNKFNLLIEEGSSVSWQVNTSRPVNNIKIIFNDSLSINMRAGDTSYRSWNTGKILPAPGLYQLTIDSIQSELYKIETIRDLAPVVHIRSPRQYTTIDFGEPQQVLTRVDMADDYGIKDAAITATIASGNGEAVKFKAKKIALPGFVPGQTQYQLQKLLLLPGLGMQPGDELYFYIKATDNHQQETRSDIYIIHLADTAQLMSLEGLANGVNIKPEYFRSQRQIIIETEQLLKDKDTISAGAFKNRSNNLGIDQKMLRLRYGKFLGEEDESGLFEGKQTNDLSDPSDFSNAEKLKNAFTDKHDNAEDATFLEPGIKAQLRATLTEMWNAELQLRTFKPREALPFEYKALRLLKELQQKSRAYVAKTNFKTTPLDLQKRMTGDLSKISMPVFQNNIKANDDPQNIIRAALGILEEIKLTNTTKNLSQETIRQANIHLNESAIQQPSFYLQSVQAMRKILSDWNAVVPAGKNTIIIAENGLQRMLSEPALLPSAEKNTPQQLLSKQYFSNLQKKQP
jgi:hypothetical protein